MPPSGRILRIAVLGASGIGRDHIRILHSLGAQVVAVLGSSKQSAERSASDVAETCSHVVTPYWSLDRLLEENLDGVTIATPANCHFEQISAVLKRGLPVFCEKPMFWDDGCTVSTVAKRLSELREEAERRIIVNTSNTVFIDTVKTTLPPPDLVKTFLFRFHTNGTFRHEDIALDLLPHGLSMLLRFFGERALTNFNWDISEYNCVCQFDYGACRVNFDFQEHPQRAKFLSFRVNGQEYERIQKGRGDSYQVMLRETNCGTIRESPDPFIVYISAFLELCCNQNIRCDTTFEEAETNMNLMAQCIESGRMM